MAQNEFSFDVRPRMDLEDLRSFVREAAQEITRLGQLAAQGSLSPIAAQQRVGRVEETVRATRVASRPNLGDQADQANLVAANELANARRQFAQVTKEATEQTAAIAAAARQEVDARQNAVRQQLETQRIIAERAAQGEDLLAAERQLAVLTRRQAAQQGAMVERELANDAEYIQAQAQLAAAKRRQAVRTELLATQAALEPGAVGEAARLEQARRRLRRSVELQVNEASLAGGDFTDEARLRLSKQRLARAIEEQAILFTTRTDVADEARLRIARQRLARAYERETIGGTTGEDVADEAALRQARQRLRRAVERQVVATTSGTDVADDAALQVAKRRLRRQVERQIAAMTTEGDVREEGQLAAVRRRQRAQIERVTQEALAADRQYIEATAAAAVARRRVRAERGIAEGTAVGASDLPELDARRAVQQRANRERQRLHEVETLLGIESRSAAIARSGLPIQQQIAQTEARRLVLERQLTQQTNQMTRMQAQELGLMQGSLTQRLQQYIASRSGGGVRAAQEFPGLGQLMTSRMLTTASFMVSGALTYGAIRTITEMIREGEQLERQLGLVRAQLDRLGDSSSFESMRTGILGIARDTGVAADEVANIAFQLRGAFDDQSLSGIENTQRALRETEAAMKIARVTGLELSEINDSLTSTALAYEDALGGQESAMLAIGDASIAVQARFGVLARETIAFLGDIAPVAQQAGLDLEELSIIAGVAQARTGRGGAAIAEQLGRILPELPSKGAELLAFLSTLEGAQELADGVAEAIRSGQTGDILVQLGTRFGDLTKSQQEWVTSLIGGRREAQTLIPIFQGMAQNADLFSQGLESTGATQRQFDILQQTISQRAAEFAEAMRQIGHQLIRGGLGDAIQALLQLGTGFLDIFGGVLSVVADLNEAFGGLPLKVLAMAAAFGALVKAGQGVRLILRQIQVQAAATQGTMAAGTASRFAGGLAGGLTAGAATGGGRFLAGAGRLGGLAAGGATLGATLLAERAFSMHQDLVKDLDEAERELVEKMTQALADGNRAAIEEIASSKSSLTERAGFFIGGAASPEQLAKDLLQNWDFENEISAGLGRLREHQILTQEALDEILQDTMDRLRDEVGFGATAQTGNFSQYQGEGGLEDLINDLKSGDDEAFRIFEQIRGQVMQLPTAAAAWASAIAARAGDLAAAADFQHIAEETIPNLEAAMAAYEAGTGSSGEVLAILQGIINAYERAGSKDADTIAEEARIRKQMAGIQADIALQLYESAQGIAEATGAFAADPTARVEMIRATLANPNLNPDQRMQVTLDLVEAIKAVHQAEVEAADSALERLNLIREGYELAPDDRATFIRAQLAPIAEKVRAFTAQGAASFGITAEAFTDAMVQAGLEVEGATADVRDIARRALEITLEEARRLYRTLRRAGENQAAAQLADAISRLTSEVGRLSGPVATGRVQTDPGELREAEKAYADELEKEADRRKREADEAKRRAEEERRARAALAEAYMDVTRARAEGNRVALARVDLQAADLAARLAAETEEKDDDIRAIAQRIRAERGLADAIFETNNAQAELAIAVANAAGETVEAARLGLEQTQRALRRAASLGRTDDVERLQVEMVNNAARLRDTQLQTRQADIDFALEMGRITTGQAIEQLTTLLRFPEITEEQTRNLQRRIRALQQEASRDFQFNIPSDIMLPTLYEVRRLNQGGGQSFVDQRQIVVQNTISSEVDADRAVGRMVDVLNSPPRTGTTSRRY